MNCGLCRDCKWWEVWATVPWGGCKRVLANDSLAQPDPRTFESGMDHDNEETELSTQPDFGCVQFEVKTAG